MQHCSSKQIAKKSLDDTKENRKVSKESTVIGEDKTKKQEKAKWRNAWGEWWRKNIQQTQKKMEIAAKELDFIEAAKYRDELEALRKMK